MKWPIWPKETDVLKLAAAAAAAAVATEELMFMSLKHGK